VVFICLSCLNDVNAVDGELTSTAALPRRPAPPRYGSVQTRDKKNVLPVEVNDCAGFLHTLTAGFNRDASIVHIYTQQALSRRRNGLVTGCLPHRV